MSLYIDRIAWVYGGSFGDKKIVLLGERAKIPGPRRSLVYGLLGTHRFYFRAEVVAEGSRLAGWGAAGAGVVGGGEAGGASGGGRWFGTGEGEGSVGEGGREGSGGDGGAAKFGAEGAGGGLDDVLVGVVGDEAEEVGGGSVGDATEGGHVEGAGVGQAEEHVEEFGVGRGRRERREMPRAVVADGEDAGAGEEVSAAVTEAFERAGFDTPAFLAAAPSAPAGRYR